MKAETQLTRNVATVRCQELGDELIRLRKAARLSLREVARMTCLDQSSITRFERGHRLPTRVSLESLLTAYRADRTTRQRLQSLAERADEKGWWQRDRKEPTERQRTLVSLEAEADRLVCFELSRVPGLLQTPEYTQSLMVESGIVPDNEIDGRMAARFCRQSVLDQWDRPELVTFIDEFVLHRLIGGPGAMRRQLQHILECSKKRGITVRIVPSGRGHAGIDGSFELIELPDKQPVVFVEHTPSVLFMESREEVESYQRIVQRLSATALGATQSVACVAKLASQLHPEDGSG